MGSVQRRSDIARSLYVSPWVRGWGAIQRKSDIARFLRISAWVSHVNKRDIVYLIILYTYIYIYTYIHIMLLNFNFGYWISSVLIGSLNSCY